MIVHIEVTDREGKSHRLEAPTDMALNLMEVCRAADLPVEGTCGGMALCASCHCYVNSKHPLPEQSEDELAMLSEIFTQKENSRLGCQLSISEAINGLQITLAPE